MQSSNSTSWQKVNQWYHKLVGSHGHYYHEHVILPNVLKLLQLSPESSVLDIGCGQGVLTRAIPKVAKYLGIDLALSLIEQAKQNSPYFHYQFVHQDITQSFKPIDDVFTHAVFLLSLQNIKNSQQAIKNAAACLAPRGRLLLVLNHPCFRIPRQSGWGIDPKTKQQYRFINRYLSPLDIPINMTPGQKSSKLTWSFHHSISDYSQMLFDAGLTISKIEEWTSDKQSEGKNAKMENRARKEFPLFLAILSQKI